MVVHRRTSLVGGREDGGRGRHGSMNLMPSSINQVLRLARPSMDGHNTCLQTAEARPLLKQAPRSTRTHPEQRELDRRACAGAHAGRPRGRLGTTSSHRAGGGAELLDVEVALCCSLPALSAVSDESRRPESPAQVPVTMIALGLYRPAPSFPRFQRTPVQLSNSFHFISFLHRNSNRACFMACFSLFCTKTRSSISLTQVDPNSSAERNLFRSLITVAAASTARDDASHYHR